MRQQAREMGIPWAGVSLHDLKLQIRIAQAKAKPIAPAKREVVVPAIVTSTEAPPEVAPVAAPVELNSPLPPLPEPQHQDDLLSRYRRVLQDLEEVMRTESRNEELIKEFDNIWNEQDRTAFQMEGLYAQTQKVTLAKEALEIQDKWCTLLRDREHAYTMLLENHSNNSGKVYEHITRQMAELKTIVVRFEEDKKRFNSIVASTYDLPDNIFQV